MNRSEQLARCKGYRVETRDGRIGSVAAVLPRAGRNRRGILLVHSGELYCRLSAVPFADVDTIDVDEQRVVLRRTRRTMREGARSGARDRIVGA